MKTFELCGIGSDHFDEGRHFAVGDVGEAHQALHAAEDVLLAVLAAEELQNGHGQLGGHVVKDLINHSANKSVIDPLPRIWNSVANESNIQTIIQFISFYSKK